MYSFSNSRLSAQIGSFAYLWVILNAFLPLFANAAETEDLFSFTNPGCIGQWQEAPLLDWLKHHHDWLPQLDEPPFSSLHAALGDTWNASTYQQFHAQETAMLVDVFNNPHSIPFASENWAENSDKSLLRHNQTQWVDLDGDGTCDLIGWEFKYAGHTPKGDMGITRYFVFLQHNGALKLIDYSEDPCNEIGYCSGQIPDAIVPVWKKGEKQAWLTARTGIALISRNGLIPLRKASDGTLKPANALWWDANRSRWQAPAPDLAKPLSRYLATHALPPALCQKVAVECDTGPTP